MDICCGYFRGNFYLKEYGNAAAPFLPVGNVSAFTLNHELTEIEQEDFTSLGGTACQISYISSATLNMTLNCLKIRNLALAFQGSGAYGNIVAGSVEDESHEVVELGALIPLAYIPEKGTVVVTDNTTPTPQTFVEGTDYVVTSAGIIPLAGGAIITTDTLLISYDYGIGSIVQALTSSQKVFEVIFDGINVGEEGEQEVVLRAWKVKFAPAATFDLITSGEFASVEVVGTILKDDTKVGAGVSKYYNLEMRDVA